MPDKISSDRSIDILIAEDDEMIQVTLLEAFRKLNPSLRLKGASSGMEAWFHIRNTSVKILLCDIIMPTMNGIDLEKALHTLALAKRPALTVFMSHPSTQLKIYKNLKGYDFLKKPVSKEQLEELLLRLNGMKVKKEAA